MIILIARDRSDALGVLYDRYNRLVFSLALGIVGDRATAEEITLDVFTRVWEKAATYRAERGQVSTWLTSITRNRAIDELRRRDARPAMHSFDWAELASDALPTVISPEATTDLALQRERVRRALADLPENQARVIFLAYFRGYTHREIAAALEQPLGTVKKRIQLGMQKLRALLEDEQT